MIPFPGESAFLATTQNTAGSVDPDIMAAIRYRAGSSTITAGDVFIGGFYAYDYLEAGASAVFCVVLVIESGSGTLSLTGGPDSFPLDDVSSSVYDLGDHVVSGAGEIVVELPWVTVSDYLASASYTAVRVECVSGTVEIGQMKLRIWPPGGPVGGWAAGSAWDNDGAASGVRGGGTDEFTAVTGSQPNATAFAYLRDTAVPAARTAYEGAHTFVLGRDLFLSSVAVGTLGVTPDGLTHVSLSLSETPSLLVWFGSDPSGYNPIPSTLVEEVDYVRPPDEVFGDYGYYAQFPGDLPAFVWDGAPSPDIFAELTGGSAVPLDPAGLSVQAWNDAIPTGIDSFDDYFNYVASVTHPPATLSVSSVGTATSTYALPTAGPAIFALLTFSGVADPPEPTGAAVYNLGMDPTGLSGHIAFPDFLYWSPARRKRPVRQFHRDDGAGVTPPRGFGGASRIRTRRAFGYD